MWGFPFWGIFLPGLERRGRQPKFEQPYLKDLDETRFSQALATFPLKNPNNLTFDGTTALRTALVEILWRHYYYYKIFTKDEERFYYELEGRAIEVFSQYQYVLTGFIKTAEANGIFNINGQSQTNIDGTTGSTTSNANTAIHSDTPQGTTADMQNYMSAADKSNGMVESDGTNEQNTTHTNTSNRPELISEIIARLRADESDVINGMLAKMNILFRQIHDRQDLEEI